MQSRNMRIAQQLARRLMAAPGAPIPQESSMSLMTDPADIARFALAGKAVLTLSSTRSGAHYTYRINKAKGTTEKPAAGLFFVNLLPGPDNTEDFTYLGIVSITRLGPVFKLTAKSRAGLDSPAVRAFQYFTQQVLAGSHLPEALEVRHEGRCGACGRTLTVPGSLDSGIGPECLSQMGL
jgi:hypothetical protein